MLANGNHAVVNFNWRPNQGVGILDFQDNINFYRTNKLMTSRILVAGSALLCLALFSSHGLAQDSSEAASEDGFKTIFDGETLEGWSGNETLWTVEDGAITGTTTKDAPLKFNQFITWTGGEVADFELRLNFRIQGGNSGIQFRSKPFGEEGQFRVGGYQADIDSQMRYMGILYEERGRGILAERSNQVEITKDGAKKVVGKTGDDEEIVAAIKADGWNEYVIRAKGNHIVQMINGKKTVDLTDLQSDKAAESGILAFQIHVGPVMKIQFKDIRLKDLSDED